MKKILFIDDDMRRMQYYVEYLELEGFNVSFFEEDRTAYEYIENNHKNICLIILDMIMPSGLFKKGETNSYFDTGRYLLRKIRGIMPKVPVIIFSLRPDLDKMTELTNLGIKHSQILVKDTTKPQDLLERVKDLIGNP